MKEQELLYILKEYKNIKNGIELSKKRIFSYIETEEDIIRQLTFSGHNGMILRGKEKNDKILNILECYREKREEQINKFRKIIFNISIQEECLDIILKCIYELAEPGKNILALLFLDGYTWDCVSKILNISTTTLSRMRTIAIKQLLEIYNNKKEVVGVSKFNLEGAEQLLLKSKKEFKKK